MTANSVKMKPANIQDTVTHFESFINDVLKEDLKELNKKLEKINEEIVEYTQIKKTLELIKNEPFSNNFKMQVDIGCNFFMEAKVKNPSTMLFNIGLDCYLELTYEEAFKYIDIRLEALENASKTIRKKSAETKAHIKLMLFNIGELQNIRLDS